MCKLIFRLIEYDYCVSLYVLIYDSVEYVKKKRNKRWKSIFSVNIFSVDFTWSAMMMLIVNEKLKLLFVVYSFQLVFSIDAECSK